MMAKAGRRPGPLDDDPRRVVITFRTTEGVAERLDKKVGVSRSEYLHTLLEAHLEEEEDE